MDKLYFVCLRLFHNKYEANPLSRSIYFYLRYLLYTYITLPWFLWTFRTSSIYFPGNFNGLRIQWCYQICSFFCIWVSSRSPVHNRFELTLYLLHLILLAFKFLSSKNDNTKIECDPVYHKTGFLWTIIATSAFWKNCFVCFIY